MKVLNLYAGLGGNRKLWKGVNVTAVENVPEIAKFYADHFPEDEIIIDDAHAYLLKHYAEFDFIWSSPPCQSHSRARFWGSKDNPVYPNLKLYEEIILLNHFCNSHWVVENVIPYYKLLINPSVLIGRHLFWSNFEISPILIEKVSEFDRGNIRSLEKLFGFSIDGYNMNMNNIGKRQILRNIVHPKIGLHIFNCFLDSKRSLF